MPISLMIDCIACLFEPYFTLNICNKYVKGLMSSLSYAMEVKKCNATERTLLRGMTFFPLLKLNLCCLSAKAEILTTIRDLYFTNAAL